MVMLEVSFGMVLMLDARSDKTLLMYLGLGSVLQCTDLSSDDYGHSGVSS